MSEPEPMETMRDALERLGRDGYREGFRATPEGFRAVSRGSLHAPEDLVVRETVRFEGVSDPEDEAVLFALSTRDGAVRGTFATSFGPNADPVAAELIRRLRDPDGARPSQAARRPL